MVVDVLGIKWRIMINLNKLAKEITIVEGGAESISIAQVKEVLKITLEKLAQEKFSDVLKLLERFV